MLIFTGELSTELVEHLLSHRFNFIDKVVPDLFHDGCSHHLVVYRVINLELLIKEYLEALVDLGVALCLVGVVPEVSRFGLGD